MKDEKIIAYKGFNKNMKCMGFQYEVGKEYEHKGEIIPCKQGFHACQNPFDALRYYSEIFNNRFCVVEQSGEIKNDGNKTVSSKIKVNAEIGFHGLFKAGIEWLNEITNPAKMKPSDNSLNDKGSDYAKIGSSGDYAKIGSSGDYAKIGSSGDYAKISSSGDNAKISSSGDNAQIGSSGDYVQIGSSGDHAKIGSSGDCDQIGSSGDYAKIGSSGDYAKISSSGIDAKIGSSGDYALIDSSGTHAQIDSTGENSLICCAGRGSIAKAKKGSWITLAEWVYPGETGRYIPKCVKTEYVDGERIKENTWYYLVNGEFKEIIKHCTT